MKDTDVKGQVIENDLRIDHVSISTWHPRYEEIANDEAEYKKLVTLTNTEIREKGQYQGERSYVFSIGITTGKGNC